MAVESPRSDDRDDPSPSPRAMVQGTGVVLQIVGALLFATTCCVCSLAGSWDRVLSHGQVLDQRPASWSVGDLVDDPARAGMMLTAMFMTVGGLAMLIFGMGMQSEMRRSAASAMVTMLLMLLVLIVAGAGMWLGGAPWPAKVWHAVLSIFVLALTPLTVASRNVMKAHPPPDDLHVLPADFDPESYKRSIRGGGGRSADGTEDGD